MLPSQVRFFEENGYLTGICLLNGAEVERIRQQFDALESNEGHDKSQVGLRGRHLDTPFIWELASHAQALDWIEALMGPNILVLSTQFFCKYPDRLDKFVAWHQDTTYW